MSLQPQPLGPVPAATARVARAAFRKGTLCLRIADALEGSPYDDAAFADLFPARGQPAAAPARVALATVLQVVEGLTDREAADAVRGRVDWKYALALELTDPGFDHTVLRQFRTRLVAGGAEQRLLDLLLDGFVTLRSAEAFATTEWVPRWHALPSGAASRPGPRGRSKTLYQPLM